MKSLRFWSWKRVVCVISLHAAVAVTLSAQTFSTLVTFNGTNGSNPVAPLVKGSDGNLYGTTSEGGAGGYGTVFKMTPDGVLTTLYSFTNGTDGENPNTMIQGADGNLYGVAGGGPNADGVIFRVTLAGKLTILSTFGSPATEGLFLPNELLQATDGNFYGTTGSSGFGSDGTVFKLTPAGVLTTLHAFSFVSDGHSPTGLIQATDGNLYGTTALGGALGGGTIVKITPAGALTVLYNFDVVSSLNGANPLGIVQGPDGNFYGRTQSGGANSQGTFFKITPTGVFTKLSDFDALMFDGAIELSVGSPLMLATDGNFYGAQEVGGANFTGTVFRITPSGILTTVYSFDTSFGALIKTALTEGSDGTLYGAAFAGFTSTSPGMVFSLGLGLPAPVSPPTGPSCGNTAPPLITSITSASSYGGYPYFASGSWLEIKGTNLADPNDPRLTASTNPGQWTASDFIGMNAPTNLDGITVSINGKPAFVWYISPTQLNVQAPEDSAVGKVAITATNCKGTSQPLMFARQGLAPGLLAPSNYAANGTQFMVATFASDGAYVLNAALGGSFGLNSRAAKPGDVIVAYGIGFGDVSPSILPGVLVLQSNTLVNPVSFSFGSTSAPLSYSGLAGNFVGLYEFYITVPPGLANGDYQINVTQGGNKVPQTMYLTVQN